jgi:DnaJ-domain-containing protein 1
VKTIRIKEAVIRHAGLLTGGVLGLLSGLHVFGLAIGTLLGYFADEILHDRRTLKAATALMSGAGPGPLDDHWVVNTISVALACHAATACGGARGDRGIGLAEKELLKSRIMAGLTLHGRGVGLVGQLVDRCFSTTIVAPDALAKTLKNHANADQREDLVRLLLTVCACDEGRIDTAQNGLIRDISVILEIPPATFNSLRREVVSTDEEAYRTLGIDPDTADHEVRTVYRRLASQFHPDTGGVLEDHQQEQSREAFMRIKNAFNRIMEERGELRED